MSKATAVTPASAGAVISADVQAKIDAEIASIQKRIGAPSGDLIKWSPGVGFTTPDGQSGPLLNAVILDFVSFNAYYDKPYAEGEPGAPACFAIGKETALMTPSPNAPAAQNQTCGTCPQNEWQSAPNGKGKACRNHRLLAILPAGEDEALELAPDTPFWIVRLPPTGLKGFDGYVANLAQKRYLPFQVVTQIGTDPKAQYANYAFAPRRVLEPGEMSSYMERRGEALARLEREPDVSQYVAPAPRKTRR